jgi:hypothetical protein
LKKSRAVSTPLVATLAAAALAAGCGSPPPPAQQGQQVEGWQTCVDRARGTAVEQRYCDEDTARARMPGYAPLFLWYYFPRGHYSSGPALGSRVPEGGRWGTQPFSSAPMSRTGSVVRGGLGGTAAGAGSSGS